MYSISVFLFIGGTPAVLVTNKKTNETYYLAFFHSRLMLQHNSKLTYFMGAYTFSSQPPFHMLQISPFPILNDALYLGPWAFFKNRNVDYVPFPTSFFIDYSHNNVHKNENENDRIFLFLGHQDYRGLMINMLLQELLDSLEPVAE